MQLKPPGVLYTFTINRNPWGSQGEPDYGIGVLSFPNFSDVRLVGRLNEIDPEPNVGDLYGLTFDRSAGGLPRPTLVKWAST